MQVMMVIAGIVLLITGGIHSVLGERLIFRRMRGEGFIPTLGAPRLGERHVRILWATWHFATVMGWLAAAILIRLGFPAAPEQTIDFIKYGIILAMVAGSLLVLVGTKSKHPGWLGMLGVAILTWLA